MRSICSVWMPFLLEMIRIFLSGDPIVNTVKESLRMLDELPDLDYVIIEDYLFKAPAIKKTPSRPTERPLGIRSF